MIQGTSGPPERELQGPEPGDHALTTVTTDDGATIAVHDLGGRGPVLLLVHATSFHGRVWAPVANHLRHRFHCLSLDLRGHGSSSLPPEWDFDWHGLGADVLAVVEGLGLERPYAAGHSSGATALLLAEEAEPGTFGAVYCYEPVVVPVRTPLGRDPDSWVAARARRRRDVFGSRDEALENYAGKAPFAGYAPAALEAYVDHGFEDLPAGKVRLRCRPETEARIAEMATAHDCFARLGQIACAVTIACGADTDAFGPAVIGAQAAPLRQATTEVLPGLTHHGPLEDPEAVAASLARSFGG